MRVLFICPRFFNYEVEITDALRKNGAIVDYFDEKPFNHVFFKIILRLWKNSKFVKKIIKWHFNSILSQTKKNYDYVIILKGESITKDILLKLKSQYKKAKFVYYAWDSISNYSHVQEYLHLFDKVFTFDDKDASDSNEMIHLPLFFSPDFCRSGLVKNTLEEARKIRIAFLGSVHSDRYVLLGELYYKYRDKYDMDLVLYFPSLVMLIGFIAANIRNIWKYKLYSFTLRSKNKRQIAQFFLNADAILDIQHPGQTGLTMRTIESLPLERKMITTNNSAKKYAFYSPNNFFFLDRQTMNISESFFYVPFKKIDPGIIEKYSVESWVRTLIS